MLDFKHFCIINSSIGSEIDRGFVNTEIVNEFLIRPRPQRATVENLKTNLRGCFWKTKEKYFQTKVPS